MKRFRYEAVDSSGTPLFGVYECNHLDELIGVLKSRGQQLKDSTELSLEEFNRKQAKLLPRLFQLRVGERIHDALLTGLPAHEAVRAIASEPIQAPLLFAMPWAYFMALMAVLTVWGAETFGYVTSGIAVSFVLLTFALLAVVHFLIKEFFYNRPRRTLQEVANQLERGFDFKHVASQFLPAEMNLLLTSNLKDQAKARAVSDIMPALQLRSNHLQRLAVAIAVPLAVLVALNLVLWLVAKLVVLDYGKIFEGFGVTLPALSQLVLDLAGLVGGVSWGTFTVAAIISLVITIGIPVVIANGWGHDWLAKIPWLGSMFKWSMQARVLRMMATLCRSGAENAMIVKTATEVSGFRSVQLQGQHIVAAIQQGDPNWPIGPELHGLPISLLKESTDGQSPTEKRVGAATTFQHLADMLEGATLTQAAVLAALIRLFVFGYFVFVIVIWQAATLLPLIKILNDLS